MKKVIAALAIILAGCASLAPEKPVEHAFVAGGRILVVFTQDACSVKEVMDAWVDDVKPIAKEGVAMELPTGKILRMCYVDSDDPIIKKLAPGDDQRGVYYIVDEEGSEGPVAKKSLKAGKPTLEGSKDAKIPKLDI